MMETEFLLIAITAVMLLTLGCLCCNIPKDGSTTTKVTSTTPAVTCNHPYIKHKNGCCLDTNSNGICDSDETTSRLISSTLKTTTSTAPSTAATTTTTTTTTVGPSYGTTTTTTKPLNPKAECVKKYGITPDTVLYLYTHDCCDAILTPIVNDVDSKGYEFRYINMASPSAKDTSIILCFYSSMPSFVPEFICSANGNSILLDNPGGAKTKITNFAKECKEAA